VRAGLPRERRAAALLTAGRAIPQRWELSAKLAFATHFCDNALFSRQTSELPQMSLDGNMPPATLGCSKDGAPCRWQKRTIPSEPPITKRAPGQQARSLNAVLIAKSRVLRTLRQEAKGLFA
jgi:hypothetical protein